MPDARVLPPAIFAETASAKVPTFGAALTTYASISFGSTPFSDGAVNETISLNWLEELGALAPPSFGCDSCDSSIPLYCATPHD